MRFTREYTAALTGLIAVLVLVLLIVFPVPKTMTTERQMGMRVMSKGSSGFGDLSFSGPIDSAALNPTKALTTEVAPSTGAGSADSVLAYYPSTYTYTGSNVTIQSGSDTVYAFDTSLDTSTTDTISRILHASNDYGLDTLSLTTKDGRHRMSYMTSTGMVDYYESSDLLSVTAESKLALPPDSVAQKPVSSDVALSAATKFMSAYGISSVGYGSPVIEAPIGSYDSRVTTVYPLTMNNLPVYDQNGELFGISLSIGSDGEVQSAHFPRSLSMISATYPRVSSFSVLKDYLGTVYGGRMYAMDDSTKRHDVALTSAKPAYVVTYTYSNNIQGQYIVPAFSFDIPESEQSGTYARRIVLPTLQSFYDASKSGSMPMMDGAAASTMGSGGVAK